MVPTDDLFDAGQLADLADRLAIEAAASVSGGRSKFTGTWIARTLLRFTPVLVCCSAINVVSSVAGAGEQHERRGDLRDRKDAQASIRAAGDPDAAVDRPSPADASADGSRGTNASSTAEISARPTPTQSSVLSTAESSARTE